MISKNEIESTLAKCGQLHLLKYWDDLSEEQQKHYLIHLEAIDFEDATKLFKHAQERLEKYIDNIDSRIQPISSQLITSITKTPTAIVESYRNIGLMEISEGHVAVVLLAGGQGTRLGVAYPKGMHSVGLPSGKTLFQIQAERIKILKNLAKQKTGKSGRICWYIMTSRATTVETSQFLRDNKYFGLTENGIILFEQHTLPCFDFDGNIILEGKDQVALAPEGNGGIFKALKDKRILEDMYSKEVRYVHVHSVDNILTKVADPVFIGYCVKYAADCAAKVVKKTGPFEALGVLCQVDGHIKVVEYNEISEDTASRRNPDGSLVFWAGNICNHFFSIKFLQNICNNYEEKLKLHVARKKIPYINQIGDKIYPKIPNGIKIEKFIFDSFEFSNKFVAWEVPRRSEFSTLKNSDFSGKDCSSTSRCDLLNLHRTYIEESGGKVECDEVEISPLLSYAGENLEYRVKGKVFSTKTVILSDSEELIVD